jgi:putative hydrolase of the HAD superfamily
MLKFELKMDSMYSNIKVIAFDADDTLWVNEPYFREVEHQFCNLLSSYETENKINHELKLKDLSMGMSGDYLDAVEKNATYVRIGSKIFGIRD